jgi:hypothetical protein
MRIGLAVLAGAAIVVTPVKLMPAASLPAARTVAVNPSSTTNVLNGVSATSARNAWAVGYYDNDGTGARDTLILHWDGKRWTQARSPSPSLLTNILSGVAGTSARNAWAVGYYVHGAAEDTLVLHWNGTAWKKMRSPNPSSSSNHLEGVWASSASNAWAVGEYRNNKTGETDTLVLHWNGTIWARRGSPDPSPGAQDENFLKAVTGTSAANAWAVGYYYTSTNTSRTLVLHWNGRRWAMVKRPTPSPSRTINMLCGVAAASRAWAVGQYASNTTAVDNTLILGWNGTGWSRIQSPDAGSGATVLTAVSSASAHNAWAVGDRTTNGGGTFFDTVILHWNGQRWALLKRTPNPSQTTNVLSGVSATSARNAWAVGYYGQSGVTDTLILHWNGTRWSRTR